MNDVDFFNQMVLPAVEEFLRQSGDVRLGTRACEELQSMTNHYFERNKGDASRVGNCVNQDQFRAAWRKDDWATDQVMRIANGKKHAKKAFYDLHHERPGVCGIARCGFPLSHEPYVFVDDDNAWLLCDLVEHVSERWRKKLGLS